MQKSKMLEELGVVHGFSTAAAGDAKEAAVRESLVVAAGSSAPLATARQVHGVAVRLPGARFPEEADALLARPGQAVGVFTADCVPILLVDPEARLVAAVHAGWRGTLAGVVGAAVAELLRAGAKAESLRAALGPRIGACCYVVGEELAQRFAARFGPAVSVGVGANARLDSSGSPTGKRCLASGFRRSTSSFFPTAPPARGKGTAPMYFSTAATRSSRAASCRSSRFAERRSPTRPVS